MQTVTA